MLVCWEIRVWFYAWNQEEVDACSNSIIDQNVDSNGLELRIWHVRVEGNRN